MCVYAYLSNSIMNSFTEFYEDMLMISNTNHNMNNLHLAVSFFYVAAFISVISGSVKSSNEFVLHLMFQEKSLENQNTLLIMHMSF